MTTDIVELALLRASFSRLRAHCLEHHSAPGVCYCKGCCLKYVCREYLKCADSLAEICDAAIREIRDSDDFGRREP